MKKSKKLTTLIAILSAFALTGCDLNSLSLDSIKDMGKNFSLMDLVDPLGWVHDKEDKPKVDNNNDDNNNNDDDGGDTTVAVTSVTISPSTLSLGVNETKTLTANVLPENATNKIVTWASTNSEVATVTNGTVKGIKAGSATIKATAGGRTGECTVTVTGNQDTPPIGEIITPQTAIELMDAAGEGKVVQTPVKVKGVVASGSSYNSTYKEYSGTFEGVNNFVLEFTDPNNILNGASADGVEVVVEGYIEKYQGNYKMAYLPANISPTGAKTTPVLVSAQAVQHEGTLTSITLSNAHRSFFVGNSFIKETVTAHYSDGSTAVVDATFTGYNMSQAGTQTVTVSYTENGVTQTTTYSITVTEKGPVEGSITYTFTNDKTSAQNMGTWTSEQFMQHIHSDGGDLITGMKPSPVNAYIGANGGSGDAAWELWDCLKVGKSSAKGEVTLLLDSSVNFTSIKVNAIGSRDDGALTINDVTKNVTKKALKTDLNPIEIEFEVQGGISELKLSSKDAASNNYAISITSIEFVGASTATAKELTSISIEGSLSKTTYTTGESYSTAGLSVKGHYDDGTEATVPATITLNKETALPGDTEIVASATYNGKNAEPRTFSVTITEHEDTDSYVVIEFPDAENDASAALTDDAATDRIKGCVTAGKDIISTATAVKVYDGKSGLKFGSSSAKGTLTITTTLTISKIEIGALGYDDNASMVVNGTTEALTKGEKTEHTINLTSPTTSIKIEGSKDSKCRFYIKTISIYH